MDYSKYIETINFDNEAELRKLLALLEKHGKGDGKWAQEARALLIEERVRQGIAANNHGSDYGGGGC